LFVQQILNGIKVRSTYALIAIAFTHLMDILDMLNFAMGRYLIFIYFHQPPRIYQDRLPGAPCPTKVFPGSLS